MTFCKVTADWNTHSDMEDQKDDYSDRVEEMTEQVIQKMQEGSIVWVGKEAVTASDFTDDLSLDDTLFMEWLYEKGTLLADKSRDKFEDWCGELAERIVNMDGE